MGKHLNDILDKNDTKDKVCAIRGWRPLPFSGNIFEFVSPERDRSASISCRCCRHFHDPTYFAFQRLNFSSGTSHVSWALLQIVSEVPVWHRRLSCFLEPFVALI